MSLLQYLQEHPDVALEIEGHTDSRGEKAYNRDLSRRRAEAIREWLRDNGIDADRLTFEGYGEERPKVDEGETCRNKVPADSTECEGSEQKPGPWAVNRRAVFRVTEGAETLEEAPQPSVQQSEPTAPSAPPVDDGCPPLLAEDANGNTMSYSREGNPLLAIAGVGYGYRSDSAFRLAILVGGVAHLDGLNRFDGDTSAAFDPAEADAVAAEMNDKSNALTDSAAYIEASFGFLF